MALTTPPGAQQRPGGGHVSGRTPHAARQDPSARRFGRRRRRYDRDRAVRVAYGDAAVGQRLEPFDDWTAYAEPLDAGRWAVDFAAGGKTVLSVLVDLPGGRVLAVEAP